MKEIRDEARNNYRRERGHARMHAWARFSYEAIV